MIAALALLVATLVALALAPRAWVALWDRAEAEANAARAADVEAEKRTAGLEANRIAFDRMGSKR